jgi:hypothetical protein
MRLPFSTVPLMVSVFPLEISPVMTDPLIGALIVGASGGVVSIQVTDHAIFFHHQKLVSQR